MRSTYLLSGLFLLVCSCSGDRQNFTIEVQVKNTGNTLLYMAQRTLSGTVAVDSALPDKSGSYRLRGYAAQPNFYIIYQEPRRYINLVVHPGDDFRVITDATSFDVNYLVEGSKDSRLIQKMVGMQTRTLEKITEISTLYENSRNSEGFDKIKQHIDSIYDQTVALHKEFSIRLIRENPGSLVSLMALYQQLGRNTPVFDYKKDFIYYAMVDSCLVPLFPHSEAVIDLNRKVTALRDLLKLETGSPAPEISLPDSEGKTISLSSFRGKKVLLVFWASWSSQSLSAFSRISSLYPQAAAGGMEFYLVSIDKEKDSWLRAIDERKIRGIHVSDMNYWDSPVVDLYHIEQLPVIYLIDEQGIIIRKDLVPEDVVQILAGNRK